MPEARRKIIVVSHHQLEVETAGLRAMFPQKPLQLLRIQAIRDVAEVHGPDGTFGRKPALTEDLHTAVLIEG